MVSEAPWQAYKMVRDPLENSLKLLKRLPKLPPEARVKGPARAGSPALRGSDREGSP
jgi:hypothetical protein